MCRWVTMWGCNTNILSEWGRGGSYEKISGWRSESRTKTFLVHPNLTQSLGILSRATVVPSPSSCFLFAVRGASWLFPTLRPTHGILSQGFLWILRRITNNLKPLFLIIFAARWMKRLKRTNRRKRTLIFKSDFTNKQHCHFFYNHRKTFFLLE